MAPSKRKAADDVAANATPSKRARLVNGSEDIDVLGADQQLHEELEEAAANLDSEEENEDDAPLPSTRQSVPAKGFEDIYLDTIKRKILDFDFEKLCSVTLANINVYACLVCSTYFQGRGSKSPAYFHALEEDHHVFINVETKKVYVLPDGYEVRVKSLDDIKFVVDPRLPKDVVMKLDKEAKEAYDLNDKKYIPGFIGMNNIKANDYFNVVMHVLAHVPPLRNYFMLEDFSKRSQLVQRFSTLVRKIWNSRAFKAHVSPHEILQEISQLSNKKFSLTKQSDPVEFLSWFLNNLHLALGGSRTKPGTSIIQKIFQGQMKITSQLITAKADAGDRLRFEDAESQVEKSRFMILTLDLPPAPLFQDDVERNIIPQVPLTTLLSKYDGVHTQERLNYRRQYRLLLPLPPFLLMHVKRFTKTKFLSEERNPTIVTFAREGLDMSPYVEPNPDLHNRSEPIHYDLIAIITHEAVKARDDSVEGETNMKVWKVQLLNKASQEWVEIQDLFVEQVRAELIGTKESYVLVWEQRRKSKGKA